MQVYARVSSLSFNIISGVNTLTLPMHIGFNNAGTVVNDDNYNANVSGTNLATELLINTALRSAVTNYVNSTYSLDLNPVDIILVGSAVSIPVL